MDATRQLNNQTTKSSFHESFAHPFQAVPVLDEDDATDVFIEDEGKPHTDETEAEHDAEEIAEAYSYYPLHYAADIEREEDVAGGT